jgi:hypothetical protein
VNLFEARIELFNNNHLLETDYNGQSISTLVIVPDDKTHLTDIALRVMKNLPYDDILSGYDSFKVIALLNIEEYTTTGYFLWEPLEKLKKIRFT